MKKNFDPKNFFRPIFGQFSILGYMGKVLFWHICRILIARVVRDGAKWPQSWGKCNYEKKKYQKIFFGQFGMFFVHFRSLWGHFRGSKNRKNFEKIFFSGIDSEWSETHFKPKISKKNFHPRSKFFIVTRSFHFIRRRAPRTPPPGGARAKPEYNY